jgi:tetratricopeptide (TPR) repeat protein
LAIAEETIVRLLNLGQPVAALIARDSVFALAERKQTAQQIGQTLKADFALTGSLRALATHFRLRAELIRVSDGTQLWVEDFLIPQSCIAGLEAELVERLILRLTSGEVSISAVAELELEEAPSPHRREAYESFLRGHHEWQTMQRHQMQDGLAHLLHAVELDPNLLQAKVEIAHVCVAQAYYGFMAPVVAANHIRRVAASIPNLQQAEGVLPALGWISFHVDHDLPAALDAFSASAHLPHDLWTTHMRAMLALSRQRFSEAIQLLSAALREDPYSPWLHARLAWAYHLKGDGPSSLEQIRHSISLFPNHEGGAFYGSLILAYQGEAGQAAQLAQSLTQRFAYFDLATAVHAYALAREGKREEALIILERLQWLSRERFVLSSFLPAIHVALGDLEAGLHDLKVARDARCPWFFQMLADPRLKELHGHPEFEQMLKILPTMEATVSAEFA